MSSELHDAILAAREAGKEVLKIYENNSFSAWQKVDRSFVTEADITAQKVILKRLKKYDYDILSEELPHNIEYFTEKRVWVIDPLDGTNDFLKRTGEFSIMIGLVERGRSILGVVYQPIGDILYFAEQGKGAYIQKTKGEARKLNVSSVSSWSEASALVSRSHLGEKEEEILKTYPPKSFIQMGSIGLKLCAIAEGIADTYFTFTDKTSQWDTCAPEIILTEAGGQVTDIYGNNMIYNKEELKNKNGVVASNSKIHSELISLL